MADAVSALIAHASTVTFRTSVAASRETGAAVDMEVAIGVAVGVT